jgi:hypothetical protein
MEAKEFAMRPDNSVGKLILFYQSNFTIFRKLCFSPLFCLSL